MGKKRNEMTYGNMGSSGNGYSGVLGECGQAEEQAEENQRAMDRLGVQAAKGCCDYRLLRVPLAARVLSHQNGTNFFPFLELNFDFHNT
jgi:hypothetical protein